MIGNTATYTSTKIVDYLQTQRSDMLSFLGKLVLTESPTSDKIANKLLLDLFQPCFAALDFEVLYMPGRLSGGYLVAHPRHRTKGQPIQLLVGHCDTVWPTNTLATMPFIADNKQLKGPGIYDMKAGLTQIIFALQTLQALQLQAAYTPVVLINSDEEKGSRDSTPAIRRLAKIARRAYILEPPLGLDGKLKTARKGLGHFTITVKGQPAHAGLDPGKGASAILELSYQIQKLFELNELEKGISVNVGMIKGGTSANVIAPIASAAVDVRVLTHADGERITQTIHALQPHNSDTELIIEGAMGRPPMEKTERNQELWLLAKITGNQLGLNLEQGTAGGGSDGNTTSLFTATLDGLGTTGDGAHAHHEFIFSEKIMERTALLTLLLLIQ